MKDFVRRTKGQELEYSKLPNASDKNNFNSQRLPQINSSNYSSIYSTEFIRNKRDHRQTEMLYKLKMIIPIPWEDKKNS